MSVLPGDPAPLRAGEQVVLHDRRGRRYLLTLTDGGEFHSHAGVLAHDELIGAPEGSVRRTSRGMEVIALRPTLEDLTLKMPRGAQVVYRKDQALIVGFGDIRPGCTVVEAGAGSGALTMALLAAVGPEGRVVSIERRPEHLEVARRNVCAAFGGQPPNWELLEGDAADHLPHIPCDRVVLDVLEPWTLLEPAAQALRPGGVLVVYTPTVPQVMRVREQLDGDGRWGLSRTFETLLRDWHVDGLAVRPDHRMVAHTAFLTTARRLAG